MTLLAEEARRLAEKYDAHTHTHTLTRSHSDLTPRLSLRHRLDADQIERISRDANDTSTRAYNLLLKTLDAESRTNQEVDELNKR